MEEHSTLSATLEEVSKFTQTLESKLQQLPVNIRTSIVLAVQELLVNIVKHAYKGESGQIEFKITKSDAAITINVTDYAKNGYTITGDVTAPDLTDLPESGMGMFIIHQSFDEVKYERLQHANSWKLVKQL